MFNLEIVKQKERRLVPWLPTSEFVTLDDRKITRIDQEIIRYVSCMLNPVAASNLAGSRAGGKHVVKGQAPTVPSLKPKTSRIRKKSWQVTTVMTYDKVRGGMVMTLLVHLQQGHFRVSRVYSWPIRRRGEMAKNLVPIKKP